MKLLKSQKQIIIKDFEKAIDTLLSVKTYQEREFICNILRNNKAYLALEYFKTQRPTSKLNKEFYKSNIYFLFTSVWWHYEDNYLIALIERIRFLRHLIKKLS